MKKIGCQEEGGGVKKMMVRCGSLGGWTVHGDGQMFVESFPPSRPVHEQRRASQHRNSYKRNKLCTFKSNISINFIY